jgi:hypothetical protein
VEKVMLKPKMKPKHKRKPRAKREDVPYEAQLKAGFLHGAANIGRYTALKPGTVYDRIRDGDLPSVRKVKGEFHASRKGLDYDMDQFPVDKARMKELWEQLDPEEREEILEEYG